MRTLALGFAALSMLAGCAAAPAPSNPRLAQTRSCNTDADCRMRLPRPRVCPGGGQSTPTACCRMNYCGICWSDCPGGGTPHANVDETVTF